EVPKSYGVLFVRILGYSFIERPCRRHVKLRIVCIDKANEHSNSFEQVGLLALFADFPHRLDCLKPIDNLQTGEPQLPCLEIDVRAEDRDSIVIEMKQMLLIRVHQSCLHTQGYRRGSQHEPEIAVIDSFVVSRP